MTIGTVKFFNTERGYGFIAPEDGSKALRREVRLPSGAEPFEPCCHVDPVAIDIVSIHDRYP